MPSSTSRTSRSSGPSSILYGLFLSVCILLSYDSFIHTTSTSTSLVYAYLVPSISTSSSHFLLSPKSKPMPKLFTTIERSTRRKSILSQSVSESSVETRLVKPISKFMGEIDLPGSKSLSNRILLLASLCEGETIIENLLESEDIEYMVKALDLLNVEVKKVKETTQYEASEWKVLGNGKPFKGSDDKEKPLELFLGNAGTAMRPLSAVLCGGEGSFLLDGVPRMRERPIKDLIDGLQQLDIDISCSDTGCPPGKFSFFGKKKSIYTC